MSAVEVMIVARLLVYLKVTPIIFADECDMKISGKFRLLVVFS